MKLRNGFVMVFHMETQRQLSPVEQHRPHRLDPVALELWLEQLSWASRSGRKDVKSKSTSMGFSCLRSRVPNSAGDKSGRVGSHSEATEQHDDLDTSTLSKYHGPEESQVAGECRIIKIPKP